MLLLKKSRVEILSKAITRVFIQLTSFILERKDGSYLVEVKDKTKIDKKDPEVFAKAKQAEEWCKIASEATGGKWIYKLLPHTAVNKINSFDAIISSASKID